jgi:cyclopropane fatty-acyl-phospholipid synthase-like methyltransferase
VAAGIAAGTTVLDAGSRGRAALHVARAYACSVTAVVDPQEAASLQEELRRGEMDSRVTIHAQSLDDLRGKAFDAVLAEGMLSAAGPPAMYRRLAGFLRSGGVLGAVDITVEAELPESLKDLLQALGRAAYALPSSEYRSLAMENGFAVESFEVLPYALPPWLRDLRSRVQVLELPAALGLLPISGAALGHLRELLTLGARLADEGAIQLFVMGARLRS